MKGKLLALFLPAGVLSIALAGGVWAAKLRVIPPNVWFWLWPSLVAVLLLALAVGALVIGATRWAWPPLAGFVVQCIGILRLLTRDLRKPVDLLWWTVPAVGIALAVMLLIWLIVTLRARWLERKMVQGVGGEGGLDQQELEKIRKSMQEAITLLKRAGRGRNALYELPWFLVIGRPAAGKTVAIKNSGLGLPVRKDWVKGVGGTHTCDFFFTNDLIFMDTPGKWVLEGAGEEGQRIWSELLRLLRRSRGRRPLDGLVVTVPADDLLNMTDKELQDQASNVREVVDLIHAELKFRFPVYLLVSKCDLVEGFVEFFRGVPPQRRDEIFGWSHEDPNEGDVRVLIPKGFQRVLRRLEAYRLEMLSKIDSRLKARRLFFFTEELKRLRRPLTVFADVLFLEDPGGEPPVFRGFYLTSGTQEGSPLGSILSQLAHNLGVRMPSQQGPGEEEPKRSYFLKEMFRDLMVGDEGLVSRTAVHWWRRRRDTAFAAFLPAGAAGAFLFLSGMSFLLNRSLYEEMRAEVPSIVRRVGTLKTWEGSDLLKALDETRKLQDYHYKLAGASLLRGFGMRQPGTLEWEMRRAFREQFTHAVLRPTLERARTIVMDPNQSCTTRAEVLYSVVWLRQGRRAESGDDLEGFDKIWSLRGDRSAEARDLLVEQTSYLTDNFPGEALLSGVSLRAMAESVRDACKAQGAGSVIESYREFQDECGGASVPARKSACYSRLQALVNFHKEDHERLLRHIRSLSEDLESIQEEEVEAEPALAAIREIRVTDEESDACVEEFAGEVLPAIKTYLEQDDAVIGDCRDAYEDDRRNWRKALKVLRDSRVEREKDQKELQKTINDYTTRCGRQASVRMTLSARLPLDTSWEYIKLACRGEHGQEDLEVAPGKIEPEEEEDRIVRPPPGPAVGAHVPGPAPVALRLFDAPRLPSRAYAAEGWQAQKRGWSEELTDYRDLHEETEIARLTDEIADYGRNCARAWKDYLAGLRLRERKTGVVEWLEALAESQEHAKLLRPASQIVAAASGAAEPPFDTFAQEMEPLSALKPFVDGKLAEYKAMLAALAQDLKSLGQNRAQWVGFQGAVAAQNPANSLVRLKAWVDLNAGSALAEGRLKEVFLQPLAEAETYLRGEDLARSQWADIPGLYQAISQRFPFSRKAEAEPVGLEDLASFLGAESGAVTAFRKAVGANLLSDDARRWLERAGLLTRIFFEKDSDATRQLRLHLTMVGEPEFDPPKMSEDYQVQEIQFYFGAGDESKGVTPADLKATAYDLNLLGEDAAKFSAVRIKLAEKKRVMGMFGSKWEPEEKPRVVDKVQAAWASMQLIARGLAGGGSQVNEKTLMLRYALEPLDEKKQKGRLTLTFKAESADLTPLLDLMKNGLDRPPASAFPQ